MNDLLTLLGEELALDLPAARASLTLWHASPQSVEHAKVVIELLERSMQACTVVGLQGFVAYLQQLHDVAQSAALAADTRCIAWMEGWDTHARAYLARPAAPDEVNAIVSHLTACPQPLPAELLEMIGELLAIPPQLPDEAQADDSGGAGELDALDMSLASDQLDPQLLASLLADAPDQLQRLDVAILACGHGATVDASLLREAQRVAHTLKGSALIVGVRALGAVAHRLEDMLEYAHLQALEGRPLAAPATRDMALGVATMEQMVACLSGDDVAPAHGAEVLQRLSDWMKAIHEGVAEHVDWPALQLAVESTTPAINANAGAFAAVVRVDMTVIDALVNRARQSIVQSHRLGGLLQAATQRLRDMELQHTRVRTHLRELDLAVQRQTVRLRENEGDLDPLELDRYDNIYATARFIDEAVQDKHELVRQMSALLDQANALARDEAYVLREQHRDLVQARMVPVKTVLPRLKRTVDHTASSTGKQAHLHTEGAELTLDADVLSRLTEPLLHLLRNAVDHGIEETQERLQAGKPAQGQVRLAFTRTGRDIEITCSDDGRGMDRFLIRAKALQQGLIEPGAQLSDDETLRLVLSPGFSTRSEVTEVSGRGVGMDVVNDRVAALKGRVDIRSVEGRDTTITLRVPLATGVVRALVVRCAGHVLALAANQVVSIVSARGPVEGEGTTKTMLHGTQRLPYVALSEWLETQESGGPDRPCVVVQGAGAPVALGVDEVIESREVILQDTGRLVRRIAGMVAATLRSDGRPMMLLDVATLEDAVRSAASGVSRMPLLRPVVERRRVMVVDDALSVRRSLAQLLHDGGYDVRQAVDGFDALQKIGQEPPHVIITDLEMPNLNGLELTRRLRATPGWASLPVVMLTSRSGEKHRALAASAGVDVYRSKPYSEIDLLSDISRLMISAAQV